METEYENYKKQYKRIIKTKLEALNLEIVALKDALFMRNQMIQKLDITIADLNTELINDRENQLEERNIAIQAIEQISVWININKRLDIKGGKYLVFDPNWIEDNKIRTAFYRNYNGIWIADNGSDDVIHPTFYMKLPNDPTNS